MRSSGAVRPLEQVVGARSPLGRTEVRVGDAYDLVRQIPPRSIDCVLTSPPYWGHRTYGQVHRRSVLKEWLEAGGTKEQAPPYEWYRAHGGVLGLEPFPDWYVAHLAEILDPLRASLTDGGSLWINLGDTYFARWSSMRSKGRQGLGDQDRERRRTPMGGYLQEKQLLLIPARFAIAMQDRRWILRNDVIWHKPNVPPRPEMDRLRLAHEHFFHFVKRPKTGRARYYYDMAAVEPRAVDVVTYNVRAGDMGHTATFPTEVIRPRIRSSCPPGGMVLDPFCGTGRALGVAAEEGRHAIGFEISAEFAALATEHLKASKHSQAS